MKSGTEKRRARILLVDDEAEWLNSYRAALAPLECQLDASSDGAEAAEMIAAARYDVIVTDVVMPGMDGMRLLQTIRVSDPDVPVILVTQDRSFELAVEAIEHGAFRYLPKPVDPVALRSAVNYGISLNRMAQMKREALRLVSRAQASFAADRAGLEALFGSAVAKSWLAFQPIVSWKKKKVVAVEALLRTDETSMMSPVLFLGTGEVLHRLPDLGRVIRERTAQAIPGLPKKAEVFVNLHPHDLNDEALFELDAPLSRHASRVVLEITERASLDRVEDIRPKLSRLREMGFRIALDDMGAGHAGLTAFSTLEPELVKLDMSLVRGVDKEPKRRKLVTSLVALCQGVGSQVIAEGVESKGERDALAKAGCDLMQGYLFAKPRRDEFTASL